MKTPDQIAAELTRPIGVTGAIEFMRTPDYTPAAFRMEIARRAIEADRAQRRPALVVLARGETFTNDAEAEVLDVEYILQTGAPDYEREDIAKIVAQLREHGWISIAEDVQEAWEDERS